MALTTFSDLVQEARERVKRDALAAGLPDDGKPLRDGGTGATAYADAVAVYLAFAVRQDGRLRTRRSALGSRPTDDCAARFARQALPMVWDFAEANPFCGCGRQTSTWQSTGVAKCFDAAASDRHAGQCEQAGCSRRRSSAPTRSSPPTRPTTTTSATPTSRTSSTSGCAAR